MMTNLSKLFLALKKAEQRVHWNMMMMHSKDEPVSKRNAAQDLKLS